MTGFGAAEGGVAGGWIRLEIRTVNHRHFNLATNKRPRFKLEATARFGGNPPTGIQLIDMLHCTLASFRA
jgi:hypothetical protein